MQAFVDILPSRYHSECIPRSGRNAVSDLHKVFGLCEGFFIGKNFADGRVNNNVPPGCRYKKQVYTVGGKSDIMELQRCGGVLWAGKGTLLFMRRSVILSE